jgi:3-methyladenine DNA glycosylase Tag
MNLPYGQQFLIRDIIIAMLIIILNLERLQKVAKYIDSKQQELLRNEMIVRNRLKVATSVTNAKAFFEVQKEFGSFDKYIWGFVSNVTLKITGNRLKKSLSLEMSQIR